MHAIWSGSICFGLVNIPVKLYSATKDRTLHFHLFHAKDKGPIHYARICEKDGKEVSWDEVIKGLEVSKGKYVYLDDEDFEKANVHKTNSIDITDFIDPSQIDPIFYEKSYYLAPDMKSTKPYVLLVDALVQTKKVGIARFVLRNHENIGIVRVLGNILVLHQLRYLDEIRSVKDLVSEKKEKSPKELNLAVKLIEELEGKFRPQSYKDSYIEDIKKLIQAKLKKRKIQGRGKKPKNTKTSDLLPMLEESIKTHKKKKPA